MDTENISKTPFEDGLYEEPDRSLFYRKALGCRRWFENCPLIPYHGEKLYPSGEKNISDYLYDMKLSVPASEQIQKEFYRYHTFVPYEHSVAGNMYTHSMPDYEKVLSEGFDSYFPRIEKIADRELREGLTHLLTGIRTYTNRCVEYLKSVGADEKLIRALEKVPFSPAENIYEAIVCWNFVMYLDCCDNLGCVASGLLPYFKGEDVTDLLENLFRNLDINSGYSMQIGTEYNDLTVQCLRAARGKRRPMIELLVSDDMPQEMWDAALDLVRTGGGQPAFYNKDAFFDGFRKRFPKLTEADLKRFCGGGCAEAMIAGLSNVGSLDAGINLMTIFLDVLYAELPNCGTFEEFYSVYMKKLNETSAYVADCIAKSQESRAELDPLPMRTLLVSDCIDNGKDFNNGGARYQWSVVNFAGIINLIDSLLVVRDYVFEDKTLTAEELCRLLRENDDEFLKKARNHKNRFGIDNDDADRLAARVSHDVFATLDGKKTFFGDGFLPASIQFNTYAVVGSYIKATPDGRHDGETLCDSLSAIFNKDTSGPTALINSITKLDLKAALGVPIVNFTVSPDYGNDILKGLITAYLKLGGMQMQITSVSKETLLDALDHPDDHQNLIVRVGGYSEYFCRLSPETRQAVVDRTVNKL